MKISTLSSLIAAVLLAACGASEPAPVAPAAPEAAPAEAAPEAAPAEQHEHNFPAAIAAFHDSLAPVWHNEGADRADKACAAVADLKAKAAGLSEPVAEVPADHADAWKADAAGLAAAVDAVEAQCTGDRAGLEDSLKGLHDAFHKLIEHVGHAEHEGEAHEGHDAPAAAPAAEGVEGGDPGTDAP